MTKKILKNSNSFKDKVVSLFNTNTPKQTVCGRGNKLSKPKTQKQSQENKINSIRNPFTKKTKIKKKKKIKDRIIRGYRTLFEEEK